MEEIAINTAMIQLDQLLKWAGLIDSGGQVKLLVDDQMILVNHKIVTERRKKIYPGDVLEIKGSGVWKVVTGL